MENNKIKDSLKKVKIISNIVLASILVILIYRLFFRKSFPNDILFSTNIEAFLILIFIGLKIITYVKQKKISNK
jgi:hypothetical protein